MKTISLKEFTDNFMEISNKLTHAEIRLLYTIITEPDMINLSRNSLAKKINSHRRTVWIGLEKLIQHHYVSDINITKMFKDNCDNNITNQNVEGVKLLNDKSANKSTKLISKRNPVASSKLDYDEFFEKIVTLKQYDLIDAFFKNYPEKHTEILMDLRSDLPDNIDVIAKKHDFEEKLRIIRISNKLIEEFDKRKESDLANPLSQQDKYIKAFNENRKKAAIGIIRKFLIHSPFYFEKFMNGITAYKYDDLDEIVQKMKLEIYGTDIL